MKIYASQLFALFGTPLGNILALELIMRKYGAGKQDERGRFWELSHEELREVYQGVASQVLHSQS